jgi:phage tail-like protein
MVTTSNDNRFYPFVAYNFAVEISIDEVATTACSAAFSECDGLEMTMEVKTIREGGNNGVQIRLAGPTSYGQVTLKRGMTANFDLWNWFTTMLGNPALRASAEVVLYAEDRTTERARFILRRCVPVKLKAPPLNAKDGIVAIEELQLAYESLTVKQPSGA